MIRPFPVARSAPGTWRPKLACPAVELGLAAAAIGLVYGLALVVIQPVWVSPPPAAPGPDPVQPLGWPAVVLIMGFSLVVCAPYRPYFLALRAAATGVVSTRLAVGLTAILAAVAVLGYPRAGLGSDVFDYIGAERVWAIYHANPLLVAASSHPADWAATLMAFPDYPSPYGPLWVLITWPIVWLAGAGQKLAAYILGYKSLSLAAYVVCCGLIWWSVEPRRRIRALIVFGWSPLVLVDVLGTLHNDGLSAVGVTLAVALAGRGRPAPGLVAGVTGGLVKASAAAIAPVLVWQQVRARRWRSLLVGTLVAGGLIGLTYAPFWAGLDTPRTLLQLTGRVIWSPATLLIVASGWLPGGPYPAAARSLLLLACGLGCLLVLRHTRLSSLAGVASASGWVLLLGLLLLTSVFYAHYLVPVVALAAVSGDRRLEHLVTALSLGGMAAYGLDQLYAALGPTWYGSTAYQVIGSLLTLGPAALVCLCWLPWPTAHTGVGALTWR